MSKKIHPGHKILVKEVLPKLKNFKSDITVHDKRMLTGYQGDFISFFRESGTNLFKINSLKNAANWSDNAPIKSIQLTHELIVEYIRFNKKCLYVKDDKSYSYISKEKALELVRDRRRKAIEFYNNDFIKMEFEGLANVIEHYMFLFGKRWKSKLILNWDNNNASPGERRLRNYFGEKFLKTIKFGSEKGEIKKSLIENYMKNK